MPKIEDDESHHDRWRDREIKALRFIRSVSHTSAQQAAKKRRPEQAPISRLIGGVSAPHRGTIKR
jgi:hypothetical protein